MCSLTSKPRKYKKERPSTARSPHAQRINLLVKQPTEPGPGSGSGAVVNWERDSGEDEKFGVCLGGGSSKPLGSTATQLLLIKVAWVGG